jgi:hypothetical protein
MEKIQGIIVVLLVIAIVFSVISTILNFSLINLEFEPINIKIPSQVGEGNPAGNIVLFIEENPAVGGGG